MIFNKVKNQGNSSCVERLFLQQSDARLLTVFAPEVFVEILFGINA